MRPLSAAFAVCAVAISLTAGHTAALRVTAFDSNGLLQWTNAPVPGICTIEEAKTPAGPWSPGLNAFASNSGGQTTVPLGGGARFHRLLGVDVSATPAGFTNLVQCYGILETIAGNGAGQVEGLSYWQSYFEGWPGTWASLSRPHFAMADRAGNVYIADKNSHAILRVDPGGAISTFAGTHVGGFDGEGPAVATDLQLNLPNGLWVRADGTVYVLDTENSRVRRVSTDGLMRTLFLATCC